MVTCACRKPRLAEFVRHVCRGRAVGFASTERPVYVGGRSRALLASLEASPYNQPVTRDDVLHRLAETRAELASLGVRSLDLFGSVARGEAGPGSDVDLLVEFDKPIGLIHFFRVQRRIEEILGCHVDLVMREAVKPQLRDQIFAEAVRATWSGDRLGSPVIPFACTP